MSCDEMSIKQRFPTMKVFHTIHEIVDWRQNQLARDRCQVSIGFVPTMGALHEGHATLIRKSVQHNDFTVCSIFVNPSQFAPGEDLNEYPRTLPQDTVLLESLGCDVLFAPGASEMYPQGIPLNVEEQRGPFVSVAGISELLEGKTRPNFFRGVATVVTKLLNIVSPNIAYFGQKDIQQFIVLDTMCRELFMNVKLKMMPIARAESGLALSSRNKYMSTETTCIAANLYAGLSAGQTLIQKNANASRSSVEQAIMSHWIPYINSGDFRVDYLSIAHRNTLSEVNNETDLTNLPLVISCAVYVTDRANPKVQVRLIDNVLLP